MKTRVHEIEGELSVCVWDSTQTACHVSLIHSQWRIVSQKSRITGVIAPKHLLMSVMCGKCNLHGVFCCFAVLVCVSATIYVTDKLGLSKRKSQ